MGAHHTQTTWNTYPCPDCTTTLPTLDTLQNHYRTTHDPDWTAGYPSQCRLCTETHKRKDRYDYKRAERHFCGNNCFRTWQNKVDDTSRENPNSTAGNPVKTDCIYCGSTLTREPYKVNRGDTPRYYCNNTCQGQYRKEHCSGQNHPDWNGGSELYASVSTLLDDRPWEQISEKARNTQPECEMCGKTDGDERGHQNHAHHIVPVLAGGTHDEELLMTLCPSCHATAEQYTKNLYGMERMLIPAEHRTVNQDSKHPEPDETRVSAGD